MTEKRLRVALLNVTTTTQMGGVESFVWEIATHLPADEVQVDVLGGHGKITRDMPPGVRVRTFPYLPRTFWARVPLLRRSKPLVKLLERLSFGIAVLPTLLRERYDILHIQKPFDLPVAGLARLFVGSKVLFGCHGTDYFPGDRFFVRAADGAVSCSRFNASQIVEHYHLNPVVIFNGFDPALFHPMPRDLELRARFAASTEHLLLFAGRLIRWKGVQHLLDALSQLDPDVKLVITGEGDERERLEQQAHDLQLSGRVFFSGRVATADLPRYYSISDLVVLPSLTHETFSIVACEALACSRPVVGARVGGIPELVEELVPPGDASALANKIRALLADPAHREELARRGCEQVNTFLTWQATTGRVVEIYRRLKRGERVFDAPNHIQQSLG
ncbi:MAG: glycosyltransferase family 4 protein [Anaerolineae bacterium]